MAVFDECRIQLRDALAAWDYTSAFPDDPTYTLPKGPTFVRGWPYDILDQILQETNGEMTQPIISMELSHSVDNFRSLGGYMSGAGAGITRIATRTTVGFIVSSWADQRLGGPDMVEHLAGLIQQCAFYNRSRLPAYRNLRTTTSREAYEDRPQMWRIDVNVEGDAIVSYDL